MARKIDLTGQKIGKLTVLHECEPRGKKRYWHCFCECGNEKDIRMDKLTSSNPTKSCGCLIGETASKIHFVDLTGQKFGRWTVISCHGKNNFGEHLWNCKCSCGTEKIVLGHSLTNGHSQSCGCLKNELSGDRNKKYNIYDLSGEYGIGYTSKGEEFWFDLEDYDKIKDYCWLINDRGYVIARDCKNDGKNISLHWIIAGQKYVDHINGSKTLFDNRKCNLRTTKLSEFSTKNNRNRKRISSNTSGVTGVTWCAEIQKWRAYIGVNYKHISLGYFTNFEDAVKARKQAEEKYFGEWSFDNSQRKGRCNYSQS